MKSPVCQARQLVTLFMRYFNDEFKEAQVALVRVAATEPDPDTLTLCIKLQREQEVLRELYQEYSASISAES